MCYSEEVRISGDSSLVVVRELVLVDFEQVEEI